MKRNLYVGRVLLALVPFLTISTEVQATGANRVFAAAKSGNDANACNSVSTPCQTLAGAYSQVAAGGEIIVLESGGYGPVTITGAVTIDAPAGVTAFIHPPSGDAITINAGASDNVILRGLTLNAGANNGITANSVGYLLVEHCAITGYGNDGILFGAAGGILVMRDDDERECGTGVLAGSSGAQVSVVIRDNYTAGNGNGILAAPGSFVSVTNSTAATDGNGFYVHTSTAANADMTLDHVQVSGCSYGLRAKTTGAGTATLHFANSVITQNVTGVFVDAGGSSGRLPAPTSLRAI